MSKDVDYRILDATLEAIEPIVRANGRDPKDVGRYVFYLLMIAAGFAEEIGISREEFRALAESSYRSKKSIDSN